MSEVEELFSKLAEKFGDNRKWYQLTRNQQDVFVEGVNRILAVMHRMI